MSNESEGMLRSSLGLDKSDGRLVEGSFEEVDKFDGSLIG